MQLELLIAQRLHTLTNYLNIDPDQAAEKMLADGMWESYKHRFSSAESLNLYLPVVGMSPGLYFDHAKIDDSKMIITAYDHVPLLLSNAANKGAVTKSDRPLTTRLKECSA